MLIRTGSRAHPVLWTLLLPVVAVGVMYARGFDGWWLGDDLANLHQIHGWIEQGRLWPETLAKFAGAVDAHGAFYRPLMMLGLTLNYLAAGTHYEGWFAVNLALHLLNTLLVGMLAHRFAAHCACNARIAAPLAAAWFGLNPMLAEGVYWVSARADAAVVCLTLLGAWLWAGRAGARPKLGAISLPLLLVAALGFKESAAVFPLQLALLWLAWPHRSTPAQRLAVWSCFGLVVVFLLWRAWLFGSAWQVYAQPANGGLLAALASLPAWWLALSASSQLFGVAFVGVSALAVAIALVAGRDSQARLALAVFAASGGLALATLLNLGALSAAGDGGRLSYAPLAWLAVGLGLALARGRRVLGRTDRARSAAVAVLTVATAIGAWVLHLQLRATLDAQQELQALAAAVPAWSEQHPGLTVLIVPERRGPVVTGRNAQGALVLPPIQAQGLMHRVLPTLPAELAERHAQLEGGLARRLEALQPQRVDDAVLGSLLLTAAGRAPDHLACWSRPEGRIIELADVGWSAREAWVARAEAAAARCLEADPG